jgi:hypothetical protein
MSPPAAHPDRRREPGRPLGQRLFRAAHRQQARRAERAWARTVRRRWAQPDQGGWPPRRPDPPTTGTRIRQRADQERER